MTIIQGIILGLVQGLGEFLPISSSGHLMLARILMGIESETPAFRVLDILMHVGTLLPLAIVFWKEWLDMLRHPLKNKTLLYLFIASLPCLLFYVLIDYDLFESGWLLGPSFMFTAILLILLDLISSRQKNPLQEVTLPGALLMGFMQGFGLMKGVSRSGSTMFGGILSGMNRVTCAKFSFMMSVPAILASLLVEGKRALEENLFASLELLPTLCAIAVAAIVGYLTIRFMLQIIAKIPLSLFSVYLLILSILIMAYQLAGGAGFPRFAFPEGAQLIKLLN